MKVKIQNFHQGELACPCCGRYSIAEEALIKLQALRYLFGFPLSISSGFRCKKHNKQTGGSAKSKHLLGIAFDIKTTGMSPDRKHKFVMLGSQIFNGVGVYDKHIHLDSRKTPSFWVGKSK